MASMPPCERVNLILVYTKQKKMKIRTLIILFIFLALQSCEEFLEEDPKGRISASYIETEAGLNDLTIACYFGTRNVVEPLGFLAHLVSDEFTYGATGRDEITLTEGRTSDMINSPYTYNLWSAIYNNLNNINYGLANVSNIFFDDPEDQNTLKGELSFLRSWHLYLAVETWGEGAHFQTEPSVGAVTEGNQVSISEFYTTILDDLNTAISNLPPSPAEPGRVDMYGAMAMKARILLSLAGYSDGVLSSAGIARTQLYMEAKTLADDVIAQSGRTLLDDYASIFDVYNENNNEILWSVQFTSNLAYNTNGQRLHRYWVSKYNSSAHTGLVIPKLPSHSIVYGREYRTMMPTRWLLELYVPHDKRYDGSFLKTYLRLENEVPVPGDTALIRVPTVVSQETYDYYESKGIAIDGITDFYDENGVPTSNGRSYFIQFSKYLDPSRTIPKLEEGFKDVIVIRLGEMYLVAAECALNLGNSVEAASYITDLRKRAVVPGYEAELAVDPGELDMDYILDERSRELAGEEIRWYDLKRTNKLVERVKKYNPDALYIEEMHNVRAIPNSEIQRVTNPESFKQNTGYPTSN